MPVILVVERDPNDAQKISDALRSEGWSVEIAAGADAALRSATDQAPRLVLVAAGSAEAGRLVSAFARRRGGPGVVVLLDTGEAAPADADATLQKPLFLDELRETVREQLRVTPQMVHEIRAERGGGGRPLTSADIFADVLAEVEAEVGWPPPPAKEQQAPASVSPRPEPTAGPPTAPAAASTPRPSARQVDDIDRQLEKTLSGVLELGGLRRRPPAPAAPPAPVVPPSEPVPPSAPPAGPSPIAIPAQAPAAAAASSAIEDLLDRTLSSLELPGRARKPPTPVTPTPVAPTPVAPTPTASAPQVPPAAPPPAAPPQIWAAAPPIPVVTPPPSPALPTFELAPPEIPELEAFESSPFPDLPEIPPPAAPSVPAPAAAAPEPANEFRTVKMPSLDALARAEPASTEAPGETLGEYKLLERIAVGGMAEVWKARRRGVEGFQKTVAIKRILAHLTATPDFVKMFIDEANLAAQLNHDNIIQIYHLGKEGGDLFIAMEYVEGMDLRTMLSTARQKERRLPAGLALLIAARVARALDYAHRKRDFDHRALGLVHRDVSPQNVLISYEGEVKLCDFGIVKAVAKASTTQMGALKGKLQYMSPEQAWGKNVDARSDIFSLGSVLYEMLTGRKLFAADTEVGVLDAVRECVVPALGELDPHLPPGKVDRILHKALAKRPEDRYQTAGELEQELEALLFSLKPTPSLSELAGYMKRLVEEPAAGSPWPEAPPLVPADIQTDAVLTAAPAPQEASASASAASESAPAQTRQWLLLLLLVLTVLAAVIVFSLRTPKHEENPDATPSAPEAPAPEGATPAGDGTQSTGAVPENLEELVKERLGEREEAIRKSMEAQKRRLEEQLRRTQQENQRLEEAASDTPGTEAQPPPPSQGDKPGGGGRP